MPADLDIEFAVPEDLLSLGVELDEPTATAAHALVEEFETPHARAVGVRRADVLELPNTDPAEQLDTGAAEVALLFPEAGQVGLVSGLTLDLTHIDIAAHIVAAIAHTMRVTPDRRGHETSPG